MTSTLFGSSRFDKVRHPVKNLLLFSGWLIVKMGLETSYEFQVSFHLIDVPQPTFYTSG
jgi:hypothetical protein